MNNNQQNFDRLVQVFSCEMLDSKQQSSENWKKGKLFLMERSLHFSSLFNYSATTFNFNQQLIKLEYSQVKQFDDNDENDQLIITTHKQNLLIFRNFFAQRPQVMEILRSINLKQSNFQPIQENDLYDWEACNNQSQQILPELLKLKEGNKYNPSTVFELEGLEIHQIFALLYDDIQYKPSQYFKLDVKEVDKNKTYQNVLHFFFEQILGDQEINCNPWFPEVPEYLRTGNLTKGPSLENQKIEKLPFRTINYVHPTKLPFFGTINPKVKMIQKLLLINQNEFIVQVQSETSGLPKSDCYKMMSHERAIRIGDKKFRIECTFTIEWQQRIILISNQVDNAGAIESKRVLDTFYIPYAKARLIEALKQNADQIQYEQEEQSNKSIIIGQQPSIVHIRRQAKSESQVFPLQFSPENQRNYDFNTQRISELDSNLQKLKNQIKQLQLQIVLQDTKIKRLNEEQQASLLLSKTFALVILIILISNWIIK